MTAEPWAPADIDLFADQVPLDPYPYYGALRGQAAAVYLKKTDAWAVTRYAEIRAALAKPHVFSSKNAAFNELMNQALVGSSLATDPPDHKPLRQVLMQGLSPRALRPHQSDIDAKADAIVAPLVERGTFDAVEDLAVALPVAVVADLIGVRGEVRDKMLPWGYASTCLGR